MTDEIASFKVTAADNQEQRVHPSGDAHMQNTAILSTERFHRRLFSGLSSSFQMSPTFKSSQTLF